MEQHLAYVLAVTVGMVGASAFQTTSLMCVAQHRYFLATFCWSVVILFIVLALWGLINFILLMLGGPTWP